jgi:hypothetical protein
MARPSAPGLGSRLSAKELVDGLRCSAGRRNSVDGRGSDFLAPRRSNALLGRRLSFSGDASRRIARILGRGGDAAGLEMCLECLISGILDVYWPILVVLRFSATEESGCSDLARVDGPSGDMLGLPFPLRQTMEGGVRFSLLACLPSWLIRAELRERCDVWCVGGAERSE